MKRGKNSKNEIGLWSKPGGTVEFREIVIEAMKREIKEELDIEIKIWGYTFHTDHIIKNENQHWVSFSYLADIQSGVPKIMESDKCEKIKWFSLDELPKKINQTTLESIQHYINKKYLKI